MLTAVAPMPKTHAGDTDDIGRSVFANVDDGTLQVLDRHADEEILPRSWLIARILQEWAEQHSGCGSDAPTMDADPLQWTITGESPPTN